MSWLSRVMANRRMARARELRPGSFVMEAEWHRAEELRPDRLGPGQDDVPNPEPVDKWRPVRTLGPLS